MGDNIKLVVSDLRSDAGWWDQISAQLQTGATAIGEYTSLPYATLDGISEALGGRAAYEQTTEQLLTLLSGGVTETASIATRLRSTADDFEKTDQQAAGDYGG